MALSIPTIIFFIWLFMIISLLLRKGKKAVLIEIGTYRGDGQWCWFRCILPWTFFHTLVNWTSNGNGKTVSLTVHPVSIQTLCKCLVQLELLSFSYDDHKQPDKDVLHIFHVISVRLKFYCDKLSGNSWHIFCTND